MAYFSNGTEGAAFASLECEGCFFLERDTHDPIGCPVWLAHLLHNYEQTRHEVVRELLDVLIRQDAPNGQRCQMRIDRCDLRDQSDPNQLGLYGDERADD